MTVAPFARPSSAHDATMVVAFVSPLFRRRRTATSPPTNGPGQINISAADYKKITDTQTTELWTQYVGAPHERVLRVGALLHGGGGWWVLHARVAVLFNADVRSMLMV